MTQNPLLRSVSQHLTLLDRYLAAELIPPFLFSFALFSLTGTAIASLSELSNLIFEYDLPLLRALELLLLRWPEFGGYALPFSVLLATLMAFGRLSSDSEVIALRSCGLSLYRLVAPAVVLSLGVALISFGFNELVVPAANYRVAQLNAAAVGKTPTLFRSSDVYYPEYESVPASDSPPLKRLFYAQAFDGQAMQNVLVLQWSAGKITEMVAAQSALWDGSIHAWRFHQGDRYQLSETGEIVQSTPFQEQTFNFSSAPLAIVKNYRDPFAMNLWQALDYLDILQFSGNGRKLAMFQVRVQQKIAFPFICLIFALVGSTLGACFQQTSRATSFGLCAAIALTYYLGSFLVGALGIAGVLSPLVSAWLPNVLGFGLGGWLLVKSAR